MSIAILKFAYLFDEGACLFQDVGMVLCILKNVIAEILIM